MEGKTNKLLKITTNSDYERDVLLPRSELREHSDTVGGKSGILVRIMSSFGLRGWIIRNPCQNHELIQTLREKNQESLFNSHAHLNITSE